MSLTVGDLKQLLVGVGDEVIVIIAKDIEGNEYSPLADTETMVYEEETSWSGECYPDDEDETPEDAVLCFTLWPVN